MLDGILYTLGLVDCCFRLAAISLSTCGMWCSEIAGCPFSQPHAVRSGARRAGWVAGILKV